MAKTIIPAKKNFVQEHKTGLLITALVITTGAAIVYRIGLKQHNDFLKANDLYEVFYAQED